MQTPSFLQKFGRDIVYLSIIIGMAGWIWVDGRRQQIWNNIGVKDLKDATSMAEFNVEMAKLSLQKGYLDYPSPQSEDYWGRALKSRHLLDTVFLKKIEQLESDVTNDAGICFRTLSMQELKALEKEAWVIADSLSKLIDGDPLLSPMIWNNLFGDDIWLKAQSANPSQTNMLFQCLKYRTKMLNREALGYFYTKIFGPDCGDFWTPIFPNVQAEKTFAFTGDTYNAFIYLARRYRITPSTEIRVDGKRLPHGGYGAIFSEYCSTPGERKHSIEYEIKNPVTGRREYLDKHTFSYTVIDSCR